MGGGSMGHHMASHSPHLQPAILYVPDLLPQGPVRVPGAAPQPRLLLPPSEPRPAPWHRHRCPLQLQAPYQTQLLLPPPLHCPAIPMALPPRHLCPLAALMGLVSWEGKGHSSQG
jgi:hypothetical protein